MNALDLLRDPIWQRIALVLLHFLWQGALVALGLGASLGLLRVRRPEVRYAIWLTGLMLMAACPVATFVVIEPATATVAPPGIAAKRPAELFLPAMAGEPVPDPPPTWATNGLGGQVAQAIEDHARLVAIIAPYLVLFWFVGVGAFGGRLLLGFAGVHWLARGRQEAGADLLQRAAALAEQMGLRRTPRVALSVRAREALAVGFVRPMILLPAAWATELPPDVLQAVLAHELAHIRRRDVWVNLVQRVIETLLFYHPAVWWVSRRVRAERELCCDELAVRGTGGRVEYAQALECVARRRLAESSPLLAAGIGGRKMALLKRVRHVLGTEPDGASRAGRWSAGLIALAVPPALWLAVSVLAPPVVGQEEREREVRERERAESPEARELNRLREEERRELERRERGELRRGPFGPEFEEALRDAQRQAREAQERAEEARRRAEEMMRQMMQRGERMRLEDGRREDDARQRDTDRARADESREMMERRMRLRGEGFGPGGPPVPGLVEEIRRLREEVEQLRREVEEMRQARRRGPFGGGEGMEMMMQRMREMRDRPSDVRPPSPPGPPDRPRTERERDRGRGDEEDRNRERRDGDVPPAFRRIRPDGPPRPPAAPDAPRIRIEREEREGPEEPRVPERDEPREDEGRDETPETQAEVDSGRVGGPEGAVLNTREDGRRNLLEVSLGSDDGIRRGQDLQVYRDQNGKKFLGRIEIVYVTPDRSVGRVTQEGGGVKIEKGDSVTTKLDR